jgi:hypothetical protein
MTETTTDLMELDLLDDKELVAHIARAQEILYTRAAKSQREALANAKAVEKSNKSLLKSAGVTVHRKQKREPK